MVILRARAVPRPPREEDILRNKVKARISSPRGKPIITAVEVGEENNNRSMLTKAETGVGVVTRGVITLEAVGV